MLHVNVYRKIHPKLPRHRRAPCRRVQTKGPRHTQPKSWDTLRTWRSATKVRAGTNTHTKRRIQETDISFYQLRIRVMCRNLFVCVYVHGFVHWQSLFCMHMHTHAGTHARTHARISMYNHECLYMVRFAVQAESACEQVWVWACVRPFRTSLSPLPCQYPQETCQHHRPDNGHQYHPRKMASWLRQPLPAKMPRAANARVLPFH